MKAVQSWLWQRQISPKWPEFGTVTNYNVGTSYLRNVQTSCSDPAVARTKKYGWYGIETLNLPPSSENMKVRGPKV